MVVVIEVSSLPAGPLRHPLELKSHWLFARAGLGFWSVTQFTLRDSVFESGNRIKLVWKLRPNPTDLEWVKSEFLIPFTLEDN